MTYIPELAGRFPAPAASTREVEACGETRDGDRWAARIREETSYHPGATMPSRPGSPAVVAFLAGAGTAQVVSLVVVGLLYGAVAFVALSAVFIAICGAVTVAARR